MQYESKSDGLRIAVLLVVLVLSTLTADAAWIFHRLGEGFDSVRGVYSMDLDVDGDMDAMCVSRLDGRVAWFENLGTSFAMHVIDSSFTGGWQIHAADIDGDGDGDILATAIVANQLAWWENRGTDPWSRHLLMDMPLAKGVYAVDIDADGDNDVLGASAGLEAFTLSINDGAGHFDNQIVATINGARWVYPADIDLDGDLDFIGSSGSIDRVGWFEQTADGWVEHLVAENWEGSRAAIGVDIDNDGDCDIVSAGRYADMIIWWENDGQGNGWNPHLIDGDIIYPRSLDAVDMDFDGDMDIVANSFQQDYVCWYENLGNNNWTKRYIARAYPGPMHVDATDMDGDGDWDVLVAGNTEGECVFWEWVEGDPIEMGVQQEAYFSGNLERTIQYRTSISNRMNFNTIVDLWTVIRYPGLVQIDTVNLRSVELIPGEHVASVSDTWTIPDDAPAGVYYVTVQAGTYPIHAIESATFRLRNHVSPDGQNIIRAIGDDLAGQQESGESADQVQDYAFCPASPNPFNPTTTLTVMLPEAAELTVTVYNIAGQRVAALSSGLHQSGRHTMVFDGSSLTSGLYFIHASVPGQLDQTQKVMLVR